MEASHQQPEEDKKQSRKRYDHLRMIEKKMKDVMLEANQTEAQHVQGYEQMSFEDKNNGKYMGTFPYPYMNGYLHLGKSLSLPQATSLHL